MLSVKKGAEPEAINKQNVHWGQMFSQNKDMFGGVPSLAAVWAAKLFKKQGKTKILELGAGQGRDTIYFASQGFAVTCLEYTKEGVVAINAKCQKLGLGHLVTAICHDIRQPLPFAATSFDACYSHMLFCMALTTLELEQLCKEIHRVLSVDGLNIYTVRHDGDAHYRAGIHHGEDMYEVNGFIVHFFSKAKVELLAQGFEVQGIDTFEEGSLPRKLFYVVMQKK